MLKSRIFKFIDPQADVRTGASMVIDKGVEKFAVPFYMKIKEAHGQEISEEQAIKDIKEAGVTPKGDVKAPEPRREPAPETRPLAAAATAVETRPIRDLLTNIPANLEELIARKDELLQNRESVQRAVSMLGSKIQAMQRPNTEDVRAHMRLDRILRRG